MADKANWHKAANGGTIPFLELPDGDIISDPRGAVIMEFANDLAPGVGYSLWPCEAKPGNYSLTKKTAQMQ